MRSREEISAALELFGDGLGPSAVAAATGLPRSTVRGWRDGRTPVRTPDLALDDLPAAEYAYLLGAYLGDGHVVAWRKGLSCLRVYCDDAYPGIIAEIAEAITAVKGRGRALLVPRKDSRCTAVQSTWKHWPAVFPQHGPGMKHQRSIVLADWQRRVAAAEPRALVRGLIHSDGCRYVARQVVRGKTYRYVRYGFSNRSADIIGIFCDHLRMLDIGWSRAREDEVCINRRADVAKLDAFVGAKR